MNSESSQLNTLLTETIQMLCKSGVEYSDNLRIQGLLVVTADNSRVHVVEISDTFPVSQAIGVGSSGLGCETETETNEYKPSVQMAVEDFPVQSEMPRKKIGSSFHNKSAVRRAVHTVKPPVKRRGGFLGITPGSRHGRQRMSPSKPSVKMEDAVILVDSPEDTTDNMIEPKVESGWTDAMGVYPNMPEYPEAGDMSGYYEADMQSYNDPQYSYTPSSHRRGRRRSAAPHTVTSSAGENEQSASAYDDMLQDVKPYQLSEDGGQSFLPTVGERFNT